MAAASINQELREKLEKGVEDERFDVNILCAGGAGEVPAGPRKGIVGTLTSAAHSRQANLVSYLREQEKNIVRAGKDAVPAAQIVGQFWLTNSVGAVVSADVLRALIERDDVESIEPARYASLNELIDEALPTAVTQNDSGIGWGVERINAPMLWDQGITGEGALVAVLDSGVNYRHPDLQGRMWNSGDPALPRHGFDFETDDDDPMDDTGHGTACAGLVAGEGISGVRTGVAPGATIMALKIGRSDRAFVAAIEFAARHGVDVINLSITWKANPNHAWWRRACESLAVAGICHANSSGNEGMNAAFPVPFNINPPGNCPPPWLNPAMPVRAGTSSAVTCGATTRADALTNLTGRGPVAWNAGSFTDYRNPPGLIKPDLCAPGPDTPTCHHRFGRDTDAPAYFDFRGTSASTPHIAGCMALLVHATRRAGLEPDPARILEALESTAVRISGQTQAKQNNFGAGRVDVLAAFEFGEARGWWQ